MSKLIVLRVLLIITIFELIIHQQSTCFSDFALNFGNPLIPANPEFIFGINFLDSPSYFSSLYISQQQSPTTLNAYVLSVSIYTESLDRFPLISFSNTPQFRFASSRSALVSFQKNTTEPLHFASTIYKFNCKTIKV